MQRKALITGSSGFIGKALYTKLFVDGWHIKDFDIQVDQDIRDEECVKEAIEGKDLVFHQAASHLIKSYIDPYGDAQTNILGTLNILRYSGIKKIPVVMASTGSVHGPGGIPGTYYGVSKRCAELYADYTAVLYGIPVSVLRYFSVYGPGMHTERRGVIGIWMRSIREGREIFIEGGDQQRAFVFIQDVVNANLVAAEGPGGLFEVGTHEMISMNDLAHKLTKRYGKAVVKRTVARSGDDERRVAQTASMNDLGWKAEVAFDEGLDRTWEWICQHY